MLHKKGDFSPRHYHSNSWLSGVYYFKQLKNSGAVQFHAHRPYGWSCSSMNPIESLEEINDITSGGHVINPIEGDLLLFPSAMIHYVEPHSSDFERISIAFNNSFRNIRTGDFNQIREGAFNRVNIDLSKFGGVCPAGKGGFVKRNFPFRLHPGA